MIKCPLWEFLSMTFEMDKQNLDNTRNDIAETEHSKGVSFTSVQGVSGSIHKLAWFEWYYVDQLSLSSMSVSGTGSQSGVICYAVLIERSRIVAIETTICYWRYARFLRIRQSWLCNFPHSWAFLIECDVFIVWFYLSWLTMRAWSDRTKNI